jgi:hypothetical protein
MHEFFRGAQVGILWKEVDHGRLKGRKLSLTSCNTDKERGHALGDGPHVVQIAREK